MPNNEKADLLDALVKSKIYHDYERAFTTATGMPVVLRSVDTWHLPHHGAACENPFCALMAKTSHSCAACLQTSQLLAESAKCDPVSVNCPHGLCETAVPIRAGDQVIGLLQTGQVFTRKPSERQFRHTEKLLKEWGVMEEATRLHELYFGTSVVPARTYEAFIALLNIFAQQFSSLSNQLMVQRDNTEPPVIRRTKEFIEANCAEDLTLAQVAKVANTSTYYFCKIFKRSTGINFTRYLSRTRVEKARHLLLNPNLRISEIAFASGFQSLTHFNRVFKHITGESPTAYRLKLPRV